MDKQAAQNTVESYLKLVRSKTGSKILLIIVIAIAFFLVNISAYVKAISNAKQSATVNLEYDNQQVVAIIGGLFESKAQAVETLSLNQSIRQILNGAKTRNDILSHPQFESAMQRLNSAVSSDLSLSSAWFASSSAACLVGSGNFISEKNFDITSQPWYSGAVYGKSMYFSNPYMGPSNVMEVSVVRGIYDENEQLVGFVGVNLPTSYLYSFIDGYDFKYKTDFFLVSNDCTIVYSSTENLIGQKMYNLPGKMGEIGKEMVQKQTEFGLYDVGGEKRYINYLPISNYGWRAVFSVPQKLVEAPALIFKSFSFLSVFLNLVLLAMLFFTLISIKNDDENIIREKEEMRAQLEEQVKEQTKKILGFSDFVIDTLSSLIEYRSLESGRHIKRIRYYTQLLLKRLVKDTDYNLSNEEIEAISKASVMHDIGKIGISDSILLKPGKLTPEEYEEMKKHTLIGCEILKNLNTMENQEYFKYCYEICRYHHERWDGNGYPDGLKRNQIPISAQVVAIADVYDALTNKRVYKEAYSHEKAVEMILSGECGVFSPTMLECFKKEAPNFLKILQKYNDEEA